MLMPYVNVRTLYISLFQFTFYQLVTILLTGVCPRDVTAACALTR